MTQLLKDWIPDQVRNDGCCPFLEVLDSGPPEADILPWVG